MLAPDYRADDRTHKGATGQRVGIDLTSAEVALRFGYLPGPESKSSTGQDADDYTCASPICSAGARASADVHLRARRPRELSRGCVLRADDDCDAVHELKRADDPDIRGGCHADASAGCEGWRPLRARSTERRSPM